MHPDWLLIAVCALPFIAAPLLALLADDEPRNEEEQDTEDRQADVRLAA